MAPLLGGRINVKKIRDYWDDILRLTASTKRWTVTASLMLPKLGAYPRQNGLAWGLRVESKRLCLPWSGCKVRNSAVGFRWASTKGRRKTLSPGPSSSTSWERYGIDLIYCASRLHLVVAAIVLWNTVYLSREVDTLRARGMEIPEEYL